VLAYRAIEDADCDGLRHVLDRFPDLIMQRGTNGNDLIGMATTHVMVRLLLDRGAEGVTAIHLAAQAGEREAVLALLELGADPLVVDGLHGGNARGWAGQGGHDDLAQLLP